MKFLDRAHIWGRTVLCPFEAIEPHVPKDAKVVDLGCGHGYFSSFLKKKSPGRKVLGIDVDARKIEFAKEHFATDDLQFAVVNLLESPLDFQADCFTTLDVFYLIPHEVQERIIQKCFELLPPGGKLVIKSQSDKPEWKAKFGELQEILAVRILKITKGNQFYFKTDEETMGIMRKAGFDAELVRVDRGYMYPHVVYVGTKPA